MKRLFSLTAILVSAIFVNFIAESAHAQSGTNVAVIDIPMVFKGHALFKRQMEDFKVEVEAAEKSIGAERDRITKMIQELSQQYKPGSPDYKVKEEEIARQQSELQVKMTLQKKDFMEKEARIYYNVYDQVKRTVAAFAERNNIALVLRYNSTEIEADNRQSVLEGINRPVIYQNRIDITQDVLSMLNAGVPPTTQTARPQGNLIPPR